LCGKNTISELKWQQSLNVEKEYNNGKKNKHRKIIQYTGNKVRGIQENKITSTFTAKYVDWRVNVQEICATGLVEVREK
jgi:hypothetical protein